MKSLRLDIRHYQNVKKRVKAKRALKRLRTIARTLIRELRKVLPQHCLFNCCHRAFLLYEQVLNQQPKDKNKIYSLHEPQVYCIAKGKDHKQYEYGSKASIASTATSNLIVGVVSHEQSLHDSHTLPEILAHVEASRGKAAKQGVCDRGYRGKNSVNEIQIILPKKALKRDTRYQKDKKRKQCRRRAAIEPIIGHLKSMRAIRIREAFQQIYVADSIDEFKNLLSSWYCWATHSQLPPIIKAARTIKKHWQGVVRWKESQVNNGILKGLNSFLQAAKRKARGFKKPHFKTIAYLITGKLDFSKANPNCLPT